VSGVRGRRITALVVCGVLGLAAAGCGSEPDAPEVPGPPADVSVPQSDTSPADAAGAAQDSSGSNSSSSGDTSSSGSGSTATPEPTGTPTPTPTPTPAADTGTGTATGTNTSTDSGGGTAAPGTAADSPTNDTAPPDGSSAQQFEDFCAQNPGAC
jgi:hypothetical protein